MLYNMLSICDISPLYQYIRHFSEDSAPSGAGDANCFKPLFDEILTYIMKFMKDYLLEE